MHYVTCEICGLKAGRVGDQKRIFMAKFPLDEDRCKRWVQVTGKEDLAYVPIEKLHQLKHICGKHFRFRDFKKKRTQLKRNAVPSLLITAKPLPDEILMGFPLHIFEPSTSTAITATVGMGTGDTKGNTPYSQRLTLAPLIYNPELEHDYCRPYVVTSDSRLETLHKFPNPIKDPDRYRTWIYNIGGDILSLENAIIFKRRRICHLHFLSKFHTRSKMLSADAVPTLHLPDMHKVLHRFPNPEKDRNLFNTWIYAIGGDILALENERIFKYRRVCHSHFEERYLCHNNRISNIAVPTLNIPALLSLSRTKYTLLEKKPMCQTLNLPLPTESENCESHHHAYSAQTSSMNIEKYVMLKENIGADNTILHSFPNPDKNLNRFNAWLNAIGGDNLDLDNHTVFVNRRVCHIHFEPLYHTSSNRLSPDAVPTLHLADDADTAGVHTEDLSPGAADNEDQYSRVHAHVPVPVSAPVSTPVSATVPTPMPDTASLSISPPEDWSTEWIDSENLSEAVADTTDTAGTKNFSWQNAIIVPIETDDNADMKLIENTQVYDNVTVDMTIDCGDIELESDKYGHLSGKEGSEQDAAQSNAMIHEGFQCNACEGEIVRFRYTCVQCKDFDLCAACETRAVHDHHYVLRVPGPRPHVEVQEMLARVRSALRLGEPLERVTADNVTVKSEEEEISWHEDWLHDDPLQPCLAVPTVPDTEVTSPSQIQLPHKTSPKRLLKQSVVCSRPAERKLIRHQSDTSSDDTVLEDSHQTLQTQETQQKLQTIQGSGIHQTVVAHKDTKGSQTKSMCRPNEVETQIVVRQYHPMVRKKGPTMDLEVKEKSDISGADENYVPDARESPRRPISVNCDGRLVRLMPLKRKPDNVVTRALSSTNTVPQNMVKIIKNTVLQNAPTVAVTQVTSPTINQSPPKMSSKTLRKKSLLHSRPAKRKLNRHQSDTSSDDTDSDDYHQALQSSETQNLQTIQGSRIHQTVVIRKDTKGPQMKSMCSPSELEDVEMQIVVQLPDRPATERQYHPVVKIKDTTESEENEELDFSGDDKNYEPDASESAREAIMVNRDGRLITLGPVQRSRDNVVTRARSSTAAVPQSVVKINKDTVLQNEPYIQLERVSAEEINTFLTNR